jgi:DNA invertase Pin-like site-specific DNA recombinase
VRVCIGTTSGIALWDSMTRVLTYVELAYGKRGNRPFAALTARNRQGRHQMPVTTEAEPLRVIGYCRVSTAKQGQHGHGLAAQRDALERFCDAHGYELLTVTTDVASGSASDRMHGRHVAIAAIESGVADALLVRALDRVTRDQEDAAKLFKQAQRNGWRLMDTDKADSGDPSQRLLADIRLAVAAEEKRKVSERTKEGLARARRAGKQLGRPTRISPALVKRIVDMRMRDGLSAQAIAAQLTEEGVPTPAGGSRWAHSTVRGVFAREGIH